MLTEDQIQELVKQLEAALRSEDCEVSVGVGFVRRPNYDRGYMEHVPTGGRTITITIGNGGGTVDESPDASAIRLMNDLRRRDEAKDGR